MGNSSAIVLPCNEYFDDECARDPKSALGAYVNCIFCDQVDAFISLCKEEAKRRLGVGTEQQKTFDTRAPSFGPGKSILIRRPLGRGLPVVLVSTTTQRFGQGLTGKASYIFEGVCELVAQMQDARLEEAVSVPSLVPATDG